VNDASHPCRSWRLGQQVGSDANARDNRRASSSSQGNHVSEPTRQNVVFTIVGTFREMPGLYLHLPQAARLFGLPPSTCNVILKNLVTQGTFRLANDGQYVAGELYVAPKIPAWDLVAEERHRARLSHNGR
jgi:hypothetical protein